MAVSDANYCFTLIDIGQNGSNNDNGVLSRSEMGKRLSAGEMNNPETRSLPGCPFDPLPFYFLGEAIFSLKIWLIRPYPGKMLQEDQSVYNYRHARPRRVIENAFGILVARWRIFNASINTSIENVEKYVKAAVVLHNYLRQTENAVY